MIALLPAILVSSLVGSLHCLAMCGPLVGLHGGVRTLRLALVHALGRLATYVVLGAAAGAIGRAVDLAGELGAVQRAATLVAGALIIAGGLYQLAVVLGHRHLRAPASGLFTAGLVRIRTRREVTRAWLIGVLTGLLPCGWLWAFVVAAAATGGALTGAAVMAVFWLGTVPAMTGALALGGPLLDRVRRRLPVVTAVVLVGLGVATLGIRWSGAGAVQVTHPSCHGGSR